MSKLFRATIISFFTLSAAVGAFVAATSCDRGYRKFVVSKTSTCMSPTLNGGELIFLKPFDPKRGLLRRYEIIVFRSPLPVIPRGIWVMRVVGLPGERVEVGTNSFEINGSQMAEDDVPAVLRKKQWLTTESLESSGQRQWALGANEVFVVGDNLGAANDSRFWGPLSLSNIIGVVERKAKGKEWQLNLDPALRTTITVQDGPSGSLQVNPRKTR